MTTRYPLAWPANQAPLSQGNGEAVAWQDALDHIRGEVKFAEADELEGSATPNTRKIRFEYIRDAVARAENAVPPSQPEGVREALEAAATVAENWQRSLNESCPNHMPVYPSVYFRDKAVADAIRALANTPTFMGTTTPPRGLVEAAEWQPIETAPKDGTSILAWFWREAVVVNWGNEFERWCADDRIMGDPDYWMPLPAPPRALSAKA